LIIHLKAFLKILKLLLIHLVFVLFRNGLRWSEEVEEGFGRFRAPDNSGFVGGCCATINDQWFGIR
jgi:hypothetical protein